MDITKLKLKMAVKSKSLYTYIYIWHNKHKENKEANLPNQLSIAIAIYTDSNYTTRKPLAVA